MNFSTLGFSVLRSLPEFAQTHESVMPSNHLILIGESVMPSNHLILIGPFSSCPQSFPATRSFSISWLFASGDQSIEALASFLPMNIQGCFPLGLTGLISLQSKGLSRVLSSTTVQKHEFFNAQPSLWSNSHIRT